MKGYRKGGRSTGRTDKWVGKWSNCDQQGFSENAEKTVLVPDKTGISGNNRDKNGGKTKMCKRNRGSRPAQHLHACSVWSKGRRWAECKCTAGDRGGKIARDDDSVAGHNQELAVFKQAAFELLAQSHLLAKSETSGCRMLLKRAQRPLPDSFPNDRAYEIERDCL